MNRTRSWKKHMMGLYRSGREVKGYDNYITYVRYMPVAAYIKEVTGKSPLTDSDDLPVMTDFEGFESIKAIRSNEKTQLIGLDAEWTGEPRQILSWQMATIKDGLLVEMIIEPRSDKRLSLELLLGTLLDYLNMPSIDKRDIKDKKDALDVTLACHAGLGDISSLYDKDRTVLKSCAEIQGGLVTMTPMIRIISSHRKENINNPRAYKVRLNIADSMCHSVADGKSLESLGEVIGIPKIELSKDVKAHMDIYKKDDPFGFAEYASRDAVITLLYLSSLYGYNKRIPITLNSASANVAKDRIMELLKCTDEKDFARKYRGTKKVKDGMELRHNKPHIKEYEDFINDSAKLVDGIAADSYIGGYNSSSEIGYYPIMTYDYDLRNAYPTAMRMLKAIDWENPIKKDLSGKYLTLDDLEDPISHMFGYVKFSFPEGIKYPTIPYKEDGVPMFLRTSDTLDGVYACGPEIYLALKLGAKVFCMRGYLLNTLDVNLLDLAVRKLVEDRNKAKPGSFEEKILKVMVNIIYGKAAQNVDPKNRWNAKEDIMETLGPSKITSPVIAAMTTSIVRAVLIAAQNEINDKKYKTYSVTTDGFITDFPEDIEALDLYGFAGPLRESRIELSGSRSIWKKKHYQDDLLNITTRGNISLSENGVCAHNGYKTGLTSDSPEDRRVFLKAVLERTGNLKYTCDEWASLREMLTKNIDFSVQQVERSANMEYDMKRKPVRNSIEKVDLELGAEEYEVSNFTTVPFEDIVEFRRYREMKKHTKCLKTKKQLERFLVKAENPECNTHIQDIEFTKLMSAVMAHRSGQYVIPMLAKKIPLKEKLAFINEFNDSDRDFDSNAWKECRKPERISNMLPYKEYKALLIKMGVVLDEDA